MPRLSRQRGGSLLPLVPLCMAILFLVGCGAAVTASASIVTPGPTGAAPNARPTATAVAVPFVPPSAARTVEASFQLTPHPTPTVTAVPSATPVGAPVAFAVVEKLLTGNCAGCHPPNQGLDLTTGHVYASIVNMPSREVPGLARVKPGDPANSYLYQKVKMAKPPIGGRMPLESPPLTSDELTSLRAWIAQGAKGP